MGTRRRYVFKIYRDARGEWRWRLVARNGRIIAEGGEGYVRRIDCERSVSHLALAAVEASGQTVVRDASAGQD